jgi:hypothetical protein
MRTYLGHFSVSLLFITFIGSLVGVLLFYDCAINNQKTTLSSHYENPFITDHDIRVIINAL